MLAIFDHYVYYGKRKLKLIFVESLRQLIQLISYHKIRIF